MKTFKQFSEQAYESYELVEGPIDYLKGVVKDIPGQVKGYASSVKQDPVGFFKRGIKTAFSPPSLKAMGKFTAKDTALMPITEPLKKKLGNNPITNTAIDTASSLVSAVPWRQTASKLATGATKKIISGISAAPATALRYSPHAAAAWIGIQGGPMASKKVRTKMPDGSYRMLDP